MKNQNYQLKGEKKGPEFKLLFNLLFVKLIQMYRCKYVLLKKKQIKHFGNDCNVIDIVGVKSLYQNINFVQLSHKYRKIGRD